MAEWRQFAAKQKAKRSGKNQGVEESKVAEEIVEQRMSANVSGKQQNYTRIGAQEYVPFDQDELSIIPRNSSILSITVCQIES